MRAPPAPRHLRPRKFASVINRRYSKNPNCRPPALQRGIPSDHTLTSVSLEKIIHGIQEPKKWKPDFDAMFTTAQDGFGQPAESCSCPTSRAPKR